MPHSLIAFLERWPADTDLELTSWALDAAQTLRCTLAASPWWVRPEARPTEGGELRIELQEVTGGTVHLGWRPTEVEDLLARRAEPQPFGPPATVYGNQPVRDPAALYARLLDLWTWDLHAGDAPLEWFGDRYSAWAQRVTGGGAYLLLRVPEKLAEAARPLLDAHTSDYTVLVARDAPVADLGVEVTIGESVVYCREALVEPFPPVAS